MQNCPRCKGSKKTTVIVEQAGKAETTFVMPCITCDGVGKVTPKRARQHRAEVNAWCKCPPSDSLMDRAIYRPDTARSKHHWDCGACGKLLQVG